jgi:R.HinP1I restriction endonuclease
MAYSLEEIEFVTAVKIAGEKTDVQVQVTIKLKQAIDVENLQVKLVSNLKGFNQIDKRWVAKYVELWEIPTAIERLLKLYTGEIPPTIPNPRDARRMFLDEFPIVEQTELLTFVEEKKVLIVSDILKGRGRFSAEWMLVIQKTAQNARWVLKPMNIVLNHYASGDLLITKQGNLRLGRITVQRKGGDGGRKTAQMLQFKINPAELFDL